MLGDDVVLEILRLLADPKVSQRDIAQRLRVSRGVVGDVACGRRRPSGDPTRARPALSITIRRTMLTRCSGCGGLVVEPCRLCEARAQRRRLHLSLHTADPHSNSPPHTPRRAA